MEKTNNRLYIAQKIRDIFSVYIVMYIMVTHMKHTSLLPLLIWVYDAGVLYNNCLICWIFKAERDYNIIKMDSKVFIYYFNVVVITAISPR